MPKTQPLRSAQEWHRNNRRSRACVIPREIKMEQLQALPVSRNIMLETQPRRSAQELHRSNTTQRGHNNNHSSTSPPSSPRHHAGKSSTQQYDTLRCYEKGLDFTVGKAGEGRFQGFRSYGIWFFARTSAFIVCLVMRDYKNTAHIRYGTAW